MELQSIAVCHGGRCSLKGSDHMKRTIEDLWRMKYADKYPQVKILPTGCNGGCDQGIIVIVNGTVVGKHADTKFIDALFENPEATVTAIVEAESKDKATLERIVAGELF